MKKNTARTKKPDTVVSNGQGRDNQTEEPRDALQSPGRSAEPRQRRRQPCAHLGGQELGTEPGLRQGAEVCGVSVPSPSTYAHPSKSPSLGLRGIRAAWQGCLLCGRVTSAPQRGRRPAQGRRG